MSVSIFRCLRRSEGTVRPLSTFRNMLGVESEELLASHSTPKLDFHPLSAVPDCLFIISAGMFRIWRPSLLYRNMFSFYEEELLDYHPCQLLAILHIQDAVFSIHNLRTRHYVLTGAHL